MQVSLSKLAKGQVELNLEVGNDEMKTFLEKAAEQLSVNNKIKGFRPGKVPYEIIKKEFGEMAIYEAALDRIVSKTFFDAVKENNLETVGQPKIEVIKLAPGNPLVYKATVALLPKVTLVDWRKMKVERKKINITEEKLSKALEELKKMQNKEILVDRPAEGTDKIIVDMEMYLDKVPVDGGQAKGHAIFLGEPYFVPGFREKILGQKKGEVREFILEFPQEHYQKNLAGKNVEFKVTLKDVYKVEPPELNDDFAKGLGQKSLEELKKILKDNLDREENLYEDQRSEGEMLEKLVKDCKVEEIPEILLGGEVEKMILELKDNVSKQGMKFEDYVANILKKKPEDLRKDFLPQAERRVKTALVIRGVAGQENISVEEKDIDEEVKKMLSLYADSPEIQESIKSQSGREYLANLIRNRKTIDLLKKQIIKTA
ncbi:MAG: trigger factor [Patescibacteria group bacterium]|nr:trigger factor [Patescibacteria group bacterium]MDD5491004.1 trigger factor [Patescibacteria group bacterium]